MRHGRVDPGAATYRRRGHSRVQPGKYRDAARAVVFASVNIEKLFHVIVVLGASSTVGFVGCSGGSSSSGPAESDADASDGSSGSAGGGSASSGGASRVAVPRRAAAALRAVAPVLAAAARRVAAALRAAAASRAAAPRRVVAAPRAAAALRAAVASRVGGSTSSSGSASSSGGTTTSCASVCSTKAGDPSTWILQRLLLLAAARRELPRYRDLLRRQGLPRHEVAVAIRRDAMDAALVTSAPTASSSSVASRSCPRHYQTEKGQRTGVDPPLHQFPLGIGTSVYAPAYAFDSRILSIGSRGTAENHSCDLYTGRTCVRKVSAQINALCRTPWRAPGSTTLRREAPRKATFPP